MKVTIKGDEFPAVPLGQWTYAEADEVKRVTGLTVGQVQVGYLQGDAGAVLAFAVVGFMRSSATDDPLVLRDMEIDAIVVDLRDQDEIDEAEDAAEVEDGPPAEGGAEAAAEPENQDAG